MANLILIIDVIRTMNYVSYLYIGLLCLEAKKLILTSYASTNANFMAFNLIGPNHGNLKCEKSGPLVLKKQLPSNTYAMKFEMKETLE